MPMQNFLLTEEARCEAERLCSMIVSSSSYAIPSDSVGYPIAAIGSRRVFACLIALDKSGSRHVLYAFSGSIRGEYMVPGYVPPCFSVNGFMEAVKESDDAIHELTRLIESGEKGLIERRRELSRDATERIMDLYSFSMWDGRRMGLPRPCPTGTGDCAGLKAINAALRKGWEIKGLAEFEIVDGNPVFHQPCEERCGLLLPEMLGLDYIYIDSDIAVIDKEAGMLSVPGRGDDKLDSASYRFHRLFPSSPEQPFVHRLDMDTSGLLVLAMNRDAHRRLSMDFEARNVEKRYEALLEGIVEESEGVIDLPIRLDVDNRPYQIVDHVNGKRAVTRWKRTGIETHYGRKCTRVIFFPETGRTHQLRVHSASGLGHPILGDRLYGTRNEGERLCLHASSIVFTHPTSGERMEFSAPSPF